jgi:hypothetical protein
MAALPLESLVYLVALAAVVLLEVLAALGRQIRALLEVLAT